MDHCFALLSKQIEEENEHPEKRNGYTISDVGPDAGVIYRVPLFSRARNNSPGVGEELKKGADFVAEIGLSAKYTWPEVARRADKASLALIVSDIRNPSYADLTFTIQKILHNNGYMLMVLKVNTISRREKIHSYGYPI